MKTLIKLHAKLKTKELVESANIAQLLKDEDLDTIGREVVDGYNRDEESRKDWVQRNKLALELALQLVENKSFPWVNCSNVKFPLLTVAALQFLARVSIQTKGRHLVRVETIGTDVDGKKAARARRISAHMSLQLTDFDINWLDDDEKAKLAACIVGCYIKKTAYEPIEGIVESEFVPAQNFVVDYYCKHLDKARRATHLLTMDRNAIQERVRRGIFLEMREGTEATVATPNPRILKQAADNIAGIRKSEEDEGENFEILEQHCWWDLDDDGYAEPYVVSVRSDTAQVLRVVARYYDQGDVHRVNDPQVLQLENKLKPLNTEIRIVIAKMQAEAKAQAQPPAPTQPAGAGQAPMAPAAPEADPAQSEAAFDALMKEKSKLEREIERLRNAPKNHIVRITPISYFTKGLFLPSPDGGVYGFGLGALLGPTNASVNTLINQMIDSGTMANTAGGFLGRGAKMKGGSTSFTPFEWKPVDSPGDDLRKNLVPLPVNAPSTVLFQLLGMLIGYSEKISGATDIMTGVSPGQNTPAETARVTVEQGMMLFSGIYARQYRAFRKELEKVYALNKIYFKSSPMYYDLTQGPDAIVAPDDYNGENRIYPAADPSSASQSQRKAKAGELMQMANSLPGFNKYLVTRRFLEIADVEDIDLIYPDPKGPNAVQPVTPPKIELEEKKLQQQMQEHIDDMHLKVVSLKSELALNDAKVQELQAKAAEEVAQAKGVETGHTIALIEAQIGAAKLHSQHLLGALDAISKSRDLNIKMLSAQAKGNSHGNNGSGQKRLDAAPSDKGLSQPAVPDAGGSQGSMGPGAVQGQES